MKFILRYTSDERTKYNNETKETTFVYPNSKIIEIEKIEDLVKLHIDLNRELIIGIETSKKYPYIEVYDSWRE